MLRSISLSFVAFGLIASATPLSSSSRAFAVKDSLNLPNKWKRVGTASPEHVLTLQIGLKQTSFDELEKQLYEVSDPDSHKYGQHLSQNEVSDLVKPAKKTESLVRDWLHGNGVEPSAISCNHAGDWMKVSLPVSSVEKMLDTTYSKYQHEDGTELVRAPVWSLPAYLHEHIETIQPTNTFIRPIKRAPRTTAMFNAQEAMSESYDIPFTDATKALCNSTLVTPNCLRSYYGTINYNPKSLSANKMGVTNYLGELNNRSDAAIAFQKFRPDAIEAAYSFPQISIAGGTVQQTPNNQSQLQAQTGVEGALDIQTMIGVAFPIDLISYSTGGLNPDFKPDLFTPTNSDEPYLEWVNFMLSLPQEQLPYVISTSYADNEQTVGRSYAIAVCKAFAQLGARGVTLLFGSGDEGVGAAGDCKTNDGRNETQFLPEFPASCPYITTVGGTYKFAPEVASLDPRFKTPFTSGGGFSNIFKMPDYQRKMVSQYLAQNQGFPAYTGYFNASGRAYPDLAAQSQNFSVVWDARVIPVDGTSASTPLMSAIIALVNDALITAGKSPLGFMNPWLYSRGYKAFSDILSGSSAGCGGEGFPAQKGWDAVTGVGTPYFPAILEQFGLDTSFAYPPLSDPYPHPPYNKGSDDDDDDYRGKNKDDDDSGDDSSDSGNYSNEDNDRHSSGDDGDSDEGDEERDTYYLRRIYTQMRKTHPGAMH